MHNPLNRATAAYFCVFTIFAAGVWLILELGSIYLTAPRDLTGTWRLREAQSATASQAFSVDQSGKYVRFSFENGPHFDAVLSQSPDNPAHPGEQTLTFVGDGWHVTATGPTVGDVLEFSFTAPTPQGPVKSGTYRRDRAGAGQTVANTVSKVADPTRNSQLATRNPLLQIGNWTSASSVEPQSAIGN